MPSLVTQREEQDEGEVARFIVGHFLTKVFEESGFTCARLPVKYSGLLGTLVKEMIDSHLFRCSDSRTPQLRNLVKNWSTSPFFLG